MSLFNNVGGIGKTDAGFGIKKAEKNCETKNIGIISFKFEEVPEKVQRAIDLFGEEDADYALQLNNFASAFDPEANLL